LIPVSIEASPPISTVDVKALLNLKLWDISFTLKQFSTIALSVLFKVGTLLSSTNRKYCPSLETKLTGEVGCFWGVGSVKKQRGHIKIDVEVGGGDTVGVSSPRV
jgi:hypothetical protein